MQSRFVVLILCLFILMGFVANSWSQTPVNQSAEWDENFWDFSFNQEKKGKPPPLIEKESHSRFDWSGNLKFSTSYHFSHSKPAPGETDFRGVNNAKTTLFLQLDIYLTDTLQARVEGEGFYDGIYSLKGRGNYEKTMIDIYESDVELLNGYLEARLSDSIDLKLGRQVVVWGKSDSFRVIDVLNPVDMTEPGTGSVSGTRLPVLMGALSIHADPFQMSIIVSPEDRWNKYPVFGSSFYPFSFPIHDESGEGVDFSDMDIGLSATRAFTGWDLTLYFADYKDKTPYVKGFFTPSGPGFNHADLTMAGIDMNWVWHHFLFKAEVAHFSGIRFSDYIDDSFRLVNLSQKEYKKTEVLLGMEYLGFKDTFIILELLHSKINNYDSMLESAGISQNNYQASAQLIYTFLNETARLSIQTIWNGKKGENGTVTRLKTSYNLTDDLTISGGIVFFESGQDILFSHLGDNDMVFFDVIYHF